MTIDSGETPFRTRLRRAAEEGVLLFVRYGVAMLLFAWLVLWVTADYQTARVGGQQGTAAFQYLQWAVQQGVLPSNAPQATQAPPAAASPVPPASQ